MSETNPGKETDMIAAKQLAEWANVINGRPWGLDKGKPRIYFPAQKGTTIYFDFPDYPTGASDDLLGGAQFHVWIEDCGQHPNWYKAQRQRKIEAKYRHGLALVSLAAGDAHLAEAIMDLEESPTAEEVDQASTHLMNDRFAEAREVLGLGEVGSEK